MMIYICSSGSTATTHFTSVTIWCNLMRKYSCSSDSTPTAHLTHVTICSNIHKTLPCHSQTLMMKYICFSARTATAHFKFLPAHKKKKSLDCHEKRPTKENKNA